MITCVKESDGTYTLAGIEASDLEIIQEGILYIFDEARKEEHRSYRTRVKLLNRPIEKELDRIHNESLLQRNIKFG